MFLFQTKPGKLLSDELGKASEARPFPRKKQGGVRAGGTPPGKTHIDIRENYLKIVFIFFKPRPGKELFR